MTTATSPFLTTAEAADELRTSPDWVAQQCKAGHLKATKMGGRLGWRIRRSDLDVFTGATSVPTARKRPSRARKAAR